MDNLIIYNQLREVPNEAKRPITAGRLKGFTDINAMWRLKKLTEVFGPIGIGWKFVIKNKWTEEMPNRERCAFCDIDLFYKWEGEWSEALPGTGGSMIFAQERNGFHTNDEAYKMALTDAISVAAKPLGLGADVYWEKDRDKYNSIPDDEPGKNANKSRGSRGPNNAPAAPKPPESPTLEGEEMKCADCGRPFTNWTSPDGKRYTALALYNKAKNLAPDGKARCKKCRERYALLHEAELQEMGESTLYAND